MKSSSIDTLPGKLYSADSVRKLDSIAIESFKVNGYDLMKRAGQVVFKYLQDHYPIARRVLVCCGAGNNAGDGYVVARLAMRAGLDVHVVSMVEPNKLQGDARAAWQDWRALGHQSTAFTAELLSRADVVIDAMLGTGLQRDVVGIWADVIHQLNAAKKPVIAIDIPSGLCADTGRIAGVAVHAKATVSFIGLKKGLFTHHGVEHCGELVFDSLSIPEKVYENVPHQAELLNWSQLKQQLQRRPASAHKHQCGHVVILGGDVGMPGAARLAAEASLRAGAGLVTVVSHPQHAEIILAGRAEIMLSFSEDGHVPADLLARASAIVVGPGMRDTQWSRNLLSAALETTIPKVVDAGALRMLDEKDGHRDDWVLTPHAGEAASLLDEMDSASIQDSRFASVDLLQQRYGGQVVLKGAGSLIQSPEGMIRLCPYGNPGMASAGMGDVLSGIIAALLAQGYASRQAVELAVCIHSLAADLASAEGQTGLLASDLFPFVRQLVNPQ